MDQIKSRAISETSVIKSELQTNVAVVRSIDQYHKNAVEYLYK